MITKAKPGEERILAELAGKMWGSHTLEDLTQEFRQLLAEPEAALFLDWQGTTPVGFGPVPASAGLCGGDSQFPCWVLGRDFCGRSLPGAGEGS